MEGETFTPALDAIWRRRTDAAEQSPAATLEREVNHEVLANSILLFHFGLEP